MCYRFVSKAKIISSSIIEGIKFCVDGGDALMMMKLWKKQQRL